MNEWYEALGAEQASEEDDGLGPPRIIGMPDDLGWLIRQRDSREEFLEGLVDEAQRVIAEKHAVEAELSKKRGGGAFSSLFLE